ncbi:hypothetical protein Q4567_19200 [Aliiglaciecola sp. 2_MG-2023]|uniref:hypothetical protein n=1 Tax=unclassified Aliiglaciecola TaxID=2593648 RepID=UPI0026E42D14|nr:MULTISPECIES: hypothetical protein [unclassified Aliiglaciecola]MDO6712869.1 hypothetical protein [Aliiglaciecola sp. 2_MG-2023]MDO6752895.1 hypothetical protein [Aliiglaciecola sp. 1_MG-2023]
MTINPKPKSIPTNYRHSLGRLVIFLALSVFLMIAFKFMMSSILIIKPEYTISQWEDGRGKLDNTEALQILDRIQRAENQSILGIHFVDELKLNELYTRLYLILAQTQKQNIHLGSAERYATKVIDKAPSHYLGYTLLTQSIVDSQTDHTEWQITLKRSLTLGRFEINNQRRLLPIIIQHWEKLTPENRELALPMLNQALNDIHSDYIAAKYMRKYNNVMPFEKLIENSKNQDRINQILQK